MQKHRVAVPVVLAAGAVTATALAAGPPIGSLPECPRNLLPLTASSLSPAVTAALVADDAKNRPQATAAAIASHDPERGLQVKRALRGADERGIQNPGAGTISAEYVR